MSMFHSLLSMGGYDADYQALLDYYTANSLTHPSTAKKTVENAFMIAVKAAFSQSTIAACPILQMLMFKTDAASGASLVNWHNPGTRNATAVNSPVFTNDVGWNGDGSSSYLLSGLNNTDLNQMDFTILTKASVSTAGNYIVGVGDGVAGQIESLQIAPRTVGGGDVFGARIIGSNSSFLSFVTGVTDASVNRLAVGRTDGSNIHWSNNGNSFTNVVNAVNAMDITREISLLAFNGSAGITNFTECGIQYFIPTSRKLTDAENAAVDAALVNYLA